MHVDLVAQRGHRRLWQETRAEPGLGELGDLVRSEAHLLDQQPVLVQHVGPEEERIVGVHRASHAADEQRPERMLPVARRASEQHIARRTYVEEDAFRRQRAHQRRVVSIG